MLELLDLNQSVSKADYKERLPVLQTRLYDLEHAVYRQKIPVVVVFEGMAGAGKGETANILAGRLDPRGFRVVSILPPRTLEMRYPWMWRFWLKVPSYGQMVIYDTSWYRRVLIERMTKAVRKREWQQGYQDIDEFEEQLAADGTIILKFWMHISHAEQTKRFKRLLKSKLTAWQVSDEDKVQHRDYDKYVKVVEEMLARTDMSHAPWTIVEANDQRYTTLKVFETLVNVIEARLGAAPKPPKPAPAGRKKKVASSRKKEGASNA